MLRGVMDITKALADENRVRRLLALRGGELCVRQITEVFGLAPSTISKHLSILHNADLVDPRQEGRGGLAQGGAVDILQAGRQRGGARGGPLAGAVGGE